MGVRIMLFGPKVRLLVVLPLSDFDEEEYREILRACKEVKIGVEIAASQGQTCVGSGGTRVKPHTSLDRVDMTRYGGLAFVGGLGVRDYFNNLLCHQLVRQALQMKMVVGAIDYGPMILARAEVLRNRRATVHPTEETHFVATGSIYENSPTVIDGQLITAQDHHASREFADVMAGAVLKTSVLK